ncbi:MAG: hypothetical protein ABIX46_14690 [Burkholderiaceae bacterium]
MSLVPMLGDFELPKVTRLETMESRDFVELAVPGRAGSLFQDLNRQPARIVVEGSIFGAQGGLDFLNTVREQYAAGEPLTFTSDIATGTDLQYVLMQQLHVQAEASAPDQIDYVVWLAECPPPPPPAGLLEGIDGGLLDSAAGMLDDAMGALDALAALGNVPELSDPTTPLAGIVEGAGSTIGAVGGLGTSLRDLLG